MVLGTITRKGVQVEFLSPAPLSPRLLYSRNTVSRTDKAGARPAEGTLYGACLEHGYSGGLNPLASSMGIAGANPAAPTTLAVWRNANARIPNIRGLCSASLVGATPTAATTFMVP